MPYTDLLRTTVFITGAEATALGAITAIVGRRAKATRHCDRRRRLVVVALVLGFWLGRPARAAEDMRDALASARTATSLPSETPGADRPRPPLADRR